MNKLLNFTCLSILLLSQTAMASNSDEFPFIKAATQQQSVEEVEKQCKLILKYARDNGQYSEADLYRLLSDVYATDNSSLILDKPNLVLSFDYALRAAKLGDPDSIMRVATCYRLGMGCRQSDSELFKWTKIAAEKNSLLGLNNLGFYYENGIGCNVNLAKAMECYRKAVGLFPEDHPEYPDDLSKDGHLDALCNYVHCLKDGIGVQKSKNNMEQGFNILKRLAEQYDFSKAMYFLGYCYEDGHGCERTIKNRQLAIYWYSKAAEAGNPGAMNNLALCYQYGKGVKKDTEMALKLFKQAVLAENASAMCNLANFLIETSVVETKTSNFIEAVRLFEMSAEKGNLNAKSYLGVLHYTGDFTFQVNYDKSLYYLLQIRHLLPVDDMIASIYFKKKDYTNSWEYIKLAKKSDRKSSMFISKRLEAFIQRKAEQLEREERSRKAKQNKPKPKASIGQYANTALVASLEEQRKELVRNCDTVVAKLDEQLDGAEGKSIDELCSIKDQLVRIKDSVCQKFQQAGEYTKNKQFIAILENAIADAEEKSLSYELVLKNTIKARKIKKDSHKILEEDNPNELFTISDIRNEAKASKENAWKLEAKKYLKNLKKKMRDNVAVPQKGKVEKDASSEDEGIKPFEKTRYVKINGAKLTNAAMQKLYIVLQAIRDVSGATGKEAMQSLIRILSNLPLDYDFKKLELNASEEVYKIVEIFQMRIDGKHRVRIKFVETDYGDIEIHSGEINVGDFH